jgi:AraC-like DNA-binding protein
MARPQGRLEGDAPKPVSFRTEAFCGGTVFPRKRQPWGELNYALSGVCEIEVAGKRYLSPPSYGIWIPPDVEHEAWNKGDMFYVTTYVDRTLCGRLPKAVRTLALTPLLKAILADFAARNITLPRSPEDHRLALVLVDQIGLARQYDSYLPAAADALLAPIVEALHAEPSSRQSLAEWARRAGVTERTLSRRWQGSTGLTFNEWRQRLKLVKSLALLEAGYQVQYVSKALGYNDPSAFIAMFRRLTGSSPTAIGNVSEHSQSV